MNDRMDFEALVERHGREVYAYLWRMLRDRHDAEDCLQETFLRAFRGFDRLKSHEHLRAWLYKVATNVARTNLRRRQRDTRWTGGSDPDEMAPARGDPADADRLREVRRLVEALPSKQRAALLMRKYQGLEYAEIADALGCTREAARANVYQALRRLRERLEGEA